MIDLPITALLDERRWTSGLERHLHPKGLQCPPGASPARRRCREPGAWPA
jgi:hypothetical protein